VLDPIDKAAVVVLAAYPEEVLLAALLRKQQLAEAPVAVRRSRDFKEAIVGIGKDFHATVTLDDDAYAELQKLVSIA